MDRRNFLMASAMAAPLVTTAAAAAEPRGGGGQRGTTPAADLLAAAGWSHFKGRKLGVLTNPTGVLRDQTHIVDSMVAAGVAPTAVFGPEHGFRGTAQAGGSEGDYRDPRTQVPVFDAYAVSATKLADLFTKSGIDTLVFDIADVGARFYTYIWSMYTAMQAAVATNVDFVVLDRPNPIGGRPSGPMLDPAFASGVGRKPIVQQHGMTAGELARLFDAEFLPADSGGRLRSLEVVKLRGWHRDDLFSDTGLGGGPQPGETPRRAVPRDLLRADVLEVAQPDLRWRSAAHHRRTALPADPDGRHDVGDCQASPPERVRLATRQLHRQAVRLGQVTHDGGRRCGRRRGHGRMARRAVRVREAAGEVSDLPVKRGPCPESRGWRCSRRCWP
jgi:hypothetical protein